MKVFLLCMAILAFTCVQLYQWASSGRMDQFLDQHSDPNKTPALLNLMAGLYQAFQDPKTATFYYRWITEKYPDYKNIARVRYQLGNCYAEQNMKTLAIEQYVILRDSFA